MNQLLSNMSHQPQYDDDYLARKDDGIQQFFFRDLSLKDRVIFWASRRRWFVERGYTLYNFPDEPNTLPTFFELEPSLHSSSPTNDPFPYAYFGDGDEWNTLSALSWGMVVFAQDARGRHVAIKFVEGLSQEYSVLRFLHEYYASNPGSFDHIIPIFDLIHFNGDWFAVMPRWGLNSDGGYQTVKEVLDFTESMLKALVFLHSHSIVHRDIRRHNILINHFTTAMDPETTFRADLQAQGRLTHVLFDFDLAVILSPAVRRLPWQFSWIGAPPFPQDVTQGEYDYDPFAFDVALLGIVLTEHLVYVSPPIPMMAPLIGGMSLTDIPRRFTAHQALQFFNDRRAELSLDQLNSRLLSDVPVKIDYKDPWEGLDDKFVRKWAHYRSSPPSLFARLLRYLCRTARGHAIIAQMRWTIHRIGSLLQFNRSIELPADVDKPV